MYANKVKKKRSMYSTCSLFYFLLSQVHLKHLSIKICILISTCLFSFTRFPSFKDISSAQGNRPPGDVQYPAPLAEELLQPSRGQLGFSRSLHYRASRRPTASRSTGKRGFCPTPSTPRWPACPSKRCWHSPVRPAD